MKRLILVAVLCLAHSSAWCVEDVFADHLKSLRSLPAARQQWTETAKRFSLPIHQVLLTKGKFFQADNGVGGLYAYSPRGYQLLSKQDGRMWIRKDQADGRPPATRQRDVPAILYPLKYLGMKDGDPGASGLIWSDVFDERYLKEQIASLVKKVEPDDKGGWWVSIPHKTPDFGKKVDKLEDAMKYLGAYLHVHLEPVASCQGLKLVTRVEHKQESTGMASYHEFSYDMVTAKDLRQYPVLKSSRWFTPDGKDILGTLERTAVELGGDIFDEEIAIDPFLAKQIHDLATGMIFEPE
jgi:hypothetical protein